MMWHNSIKRIILTVLLSSSFVQSRYVPGPATFQLKLCAVDDGITELQSKLNDAINSLLTTTTESKIAEQSWAVQLTSSKETLWSSFSTAKTLKPEVNGETSFRIASISKTMTAYALFREKSIDLDEPVTRYIPELMQRVEEPWLVDWREVSLRSLASYLSGMPRDSKCISYTCE
jgi:CubicO group peptidase (beta-lactamase class C family)